MNIKWNQESFEQLAKPFKSWSEFLLSYPAGQAAAKRGKFDPWVIFKQGGGRTDEATSDELCDVQHHYKTLIAQAEAIGLAIDDDFEAKMLKTATEVAATYQSLRDHEKNVQASRLARLNAMTDDELVDRLNQFVGYTRSHPAMFDPYIASFKARGLDPSRLHKLFLDML